MTEEVRSVSSTGAEKGVKLERYSLIPEYPLKMLATLYGRGAEKYSERNWEKGYEWSKSFDAMERHAHAFWEGENTDLEMNLPHLTAVAWHSFALLEFTQTHAKFDDRPYRPKSDYQLLTEQFKEPIDER